MIELIKTMIFPHTCPVCGTIVDGIKLCKDCKDEIKLVGDRSCITCGKILADNRKSICDKCRTHTFSFDKNISVFAYEGKMKEVIYRFKYANFRVFSEYIAQIASEEYGATFKAMKIDAIVPVPMYKKKQRKRGYNQACEIASSLARSTGIKYMPKALVRLRDTRPMKNLSDTQRYENLKGAFGVDAKRLEGCKTVLLVDDIFTSGSTLDACARVLKKAGIEKVIGLCAATGRE